MMFTRIMQLLKRIQLARPAEDLEAEDLEAEDLEAEDLEAEDVVQLEQAEDLVQLQDLELSVEETSQDLLKYLGAKPLDFSDPEVKAILNKFMPDGLPYVHHLNNMLQRLLHIDEQHSDR